MGIGNLHTARSPTSSTTAPRSLPLMGIGNHAGHGGPSSSMMQISLPLMGIGNDLITALGPTSVSSLPLMGIGNSVGDADVHGCSLVLITPHGDRKRIGGGPCTRSATHYPSWGSETHRIGSSGRPVNSLPLMGIGNLPVTGGPLPWCSGLITPHGDRKPIVRQRYAVDRGRSTLTHYPSWGSETGVARDPHSRRPSTSMSGSLPLMGIGNPARQHARAR